MIETTYAKSLALRGLAWLLAFALCVLPAATGRAQDKGNLDARVGHIETQISDMQALLGTLQTLVTNRSGAPDTVNGEGQSSGPGPTDAGSAGVEARVTALETQISALTAQIGQLSQQLSSMQSNGAGTPPYGQDTGDQPMDQDGFGGDRNGAPPQNQNGFDDQRGSAQPAPNFEATPIPPGQEVPPPSQQRGAIGDTITGQPLPQPSAPAAGTDQGQQLYQQGHQALLDKNYDAAATAFQKYVKTYPKGPQATDAQYWLGESYYQRGQYAQAAKAYIAGLRIDDHSNKAPDSMVKLAMSLDKLGERDAACTTFVQFGQDYPDAPQTLKTQAETARKNAGC